MTHAVLLLSTADTELLAARGSGALYRTANPARVDPAGLPALLDGVVGGGAAAARRPPGLAGGRGRGAGVRAAGGAARRRGRPRTPS